MKVLVAEKAEKLQVWHERLSHQSKHYVEKYLQKHKINYIKDDELCEGCVLGKHSRKSFGTRPIVAAKPGDLLHADVCGPMGHDSFSGYRYYVLFKDDFSKYRSVYLLKRKGEVVDKLKIVLAEAKVLGHTVKELLTDGGGEFDNKEFKQVTEENGIQHRFSMPFTPEQNGSAERENRTLVEAAHSMLHSKDDLPRKLWAETVNTATYVINRTGPTKLGTQTPYELWFGRQISTDHLTIFGTDWYIHIPRQQRQKFDPKAQTGCLVGYCGDKDGYRIYIPERGTVITSCDVIFRQETTNSRETGGVSDLNEGVEPVDEAMMPNESFNEEVVPNKSVRGPVLRDRAQVKPPSRYTDFAMLTYNEPNTFINAIHCDNANEWINAMYSEMQSLNENDTWELVEKPDDRNIVSCKWVYRVKTNAAGEIDKFKARLVAKGYSQEDGIDYKEPFSPVTRFDTIRAMISVAAKDNMTLTHFDVKTAFLYGELEEVTYMNQPEGYDDGAGRVCKLKKSLYGLKQAPQVWIKTVTDFLLRQGFTQSEADPCLFIYNKTGRKMMIALYVDDGLVAAKEGDGEVNNFLQHLQEKFQITYSPAKYFLSLEIEHLEDGSIAVNQEHYISKLLEKFKMTDCNSVSTPV